MLSQICEQCKVPPGHYCQYRDCGIIIFKCDRSCIKPLNSETRQKPPINTVQTVQITTRTTGKAKEKVD